LRPSEREALKVRFPCRGCMSEFAQKSSVSTIQPLSKFCLMLSQLILT